MVMDTLKHWMTLLLIFSCCMKYIFFAVDMSGILQILINFIIPCNISILCNTLNQMKIVMLDQSKLHTGSPACNSFLLAFNTTAAKKVFPWRFWWISNALPKSTPTKQLGPFIRGKIRPVLSKTQTFCINGTFHLK